MDSQQASKEAAHEVFWNELYLAKQKNLHVTDFYDQWAHVYEKVNDADAYYIAMNKMAVAILAEGMGAKTGHVIDIACGTGRTGEALRNVGFSKIHGVDSSEKMIGQARAKGIYEALHLGKISAGGLPSILDTKKYDGAICVAGISYMALHVDHFLEEVCRIVRPGGMAVYTVFEVGKQHGHLDESKLLNFLTVHERFLRDGKLDIISMNKIPYYEMFGKLTYCYLFKSIVL